jgi:DNA invertase Pin-like site-specific DNA recombinase
MIIGYARVSTIEQSLDLQVDALKKAGCGKVYEDVASGAQASRPGLAEAMQYLRAGDTLVVWRLDRLGRSLSHLIESIRDLSERGIGFWSLQERIDTTTSGGKLIFHVFGALAEFERDIIRDRTNAGLAAARQRGRRGGRPRALDSKKMALVRSLYADPGNKPREICEALKISRATLYRYLDAMNLRREKPSADIAPIMRAIGKPATDGERAERSAQLLRAANVFGLPLKRGSEMASTDDNAVRQ